MASGQPDPLTNSVAFKSGDSAVHQQRAFRCVKEGRRSPSLTLSPPVVVGGRRLLPIRIVVGDGLLHVGARYLVVVRDMKISPS